MLSIKRRLSSLSLRQKTPNDSASREPPDTNGEGDLIKAGLPVSQRAVAEQPLPQSSGTITPLINGIRDIIEDVLPMPSARHVPPDLQRRLSTLPSAQTSQLQQARASWDSMRDSPYIQTEADVLVIEDVLSMPAGEATAAKGMREPASQHLQGDEVQRVLPSENSLVWDLPQLPSTSASRPRTQGVSRPQSRALTSPSSAVRSGPKKVQRLGQGKAGKPQYGLGPFPAATSAQGFDATAQVLKLEHSQDRHHVSSTPTQDQQEAGQSRRRSPYSKPSALPKKGAAEGTEGGKASKWKQQSAQLRLAMQANKGGSKGEAAAAMLAETQQASLVPCQHCGRSFSEIAAERHIPKCQDIVHKPSRLVAGGGTGAHQRVQTNRQR
ncbi:g1115 [Coccomyxa viridis]|uniref:G1115 protein n=1 Tax=Coccomyxa viridis TaxID=1274662 RepID=A0ABP1FMP1_9CHLO